MSGFSVVTNFSTTLSSSMTSVQTTVPLTSLTTTDGHVLTMADLGAEVYLVISPGGSDMEILKCTGLNPSPPTGTGAVRGLAFYGTTETSVSANQKAHNAGSTVIITDAHYVYNRFVNKEGDETIGGIKTFTSSPIVPTATSSDIHDAASIEYVNSVAISGAPNASTTVKGIVQESTFAAASAGTDAGSTGAINFIPPSIYQQHKGEQWVLGTAGETVAYGNPLYLDAATSRYKIAHGNVQAQVDAFVAIAYSGGNNGDTVLVLVTGSTVGLASTLTAGSPVFLSDAGAASAAAGTIRKVIGTATSTTTYIFNPDIDTPTATATASKIPIADASAKLDTWITHKFGGTGADGALNVTSGTTSIDLGSAAVVVKNYTSINVSLGATLYFSNPPSSGTFIFLKSQGDVTIAGTISGLSTGGAGGAAKSGALGAGNNGTVGNSFLALTGAGSGAGAAALGAGGVAPVFNLSSLNVSPELLKYPDIFIGSGGGSGNLEGGSANDYVSGKGGDGTGALVIEVGGALNYTGAISFSAQAGGDATGTDASTNHAAGGGGGGAAGYVRILYNTLTASSGSTTVAAGSGGNTVGFNNGGNPVSGGGGGGGSKSAGSPGIRENFPNKNGGDGSAGFSNVSKNTIFF